MRQPRGTPSADHRMACIISNLQYVILQGKLTGSTPRATPHYSFLRHSRCRLFHPRRHIPKSARVLEYTGERITKAEGDVRYEGRPFTYLFGVGDGEVVIDGHGMAMFVNHSCDPNCRDRRREWASLYSRNSRHRRRRRTHLRLLPLRRRRRGALLLWQQGLPRKHVLARGAKEKGPCRSQKEGNRPNWRRRRMALIEKRGNGGPRKIGDASGTLLANVAAAMQAASAIFGS